jgi:hypothetical protein
MLIYSSFSKTMTSSSSTSRSGSMTQSKSTRSGRQRRSPLVGGEKRWRHVRSTIGFGEMNWRFSGIIGDSQSNKRHNTQACCRNAGFDAQLGPRVSSKIEINLVHARDYDLHYNEGRRICIKLVIDVASANNVRGLEPNSQPILL